MVGPAEELGEEDLNRLCAALMSQVHAHFGITGATSVFRQAGFLPVGTHRYWEPLLGEIGREFRETSKEAKHRTIRILAQRLMTDERPELRESVEALLRDHGFRFIDGTFIPIDFFDPRETKFLPTSSLSDFSTALGRLVDGDLDGALTAACGAVDTVAAEVYQHHSLGEVGDASFQEKTMKAIGAMGSLDALKTQLVAIGWREDDATRLCQNLKGSLNQAAYVMQSLRSRMGDVHGEKPVLDAVVFDSLKLASVLVSLMK
jgi:hypothetical protein